jgi:hypothetical protein
MKASGDPLDDIGNRHHALLAIAPAQADRRRVLPAVPGAC